jgi:hypothetical protein
VRAANPANFTPAARACAGADGAPETIKQSE